VKFVEGDELAREIKALICDTPNVVIATAFVGVGFDSLIAGRAKRFPPVDVRCNLHMGGTNPAPLQALLRSTKPRIRLTSCNRLHAKVILTERRAIVSSANLSRNGVGAMGVAQSTSDPAHQEAGTVITDRSQIKAIRQWLNTLDGRTISSPDDEELLDAAELFRLRGQWDRPLPPPGWVHGQPGLIRHILLDPENASRVDQLTVVIACSDASKQADQRARVMRSAGYPIGLDDFYEDFDAFTPGSVLLHFAGSTSQARLWFGGYYRMRSNSWAVQRHPTTGARYWMQFVEPFGVDWLPTGKTNEAELSALVKNHLAHCQALKRSWQFPLRDLVARLA
jgi:hypothetical protein